MLTSITPLGERSRNRTWRTTVIAYVLGSAAGGAVMGLLAGGLGVAIPGALRPGAIGVVVALVLAMIGAAEIGWLPVTPMGRRQVNEDWLDEYRGWVVGAGFGFQLGLGLVTIVTSLAVPATFLLALLTYSWQWGLVIGLTFGLSRAVPILRTRPVVAPDRLAALHRRHDSAGRLVRLGVAAATVPLAMLAVMG